MIAAEVTTHFAPPLSFFEIGRPVWRAYERSEGVLL
jgi:hypothetical protein